MQQAILDPSKECNADMFSSVANYCSVEMHHGPFVWSYLDSRDSQEGAKSIALPVQSPLHTDTRIQRWSQAQRVCICGCAAVMRNLRQLCALQSLLQSSPSLIFRSAASADNDVHGKLHTTVTSILPTLRFAVAAATRTYATDTRDANPSMDARRQSGNAASTSLSAEDQPAESGDWMDEWGKALEKNDLAAQAEILQKTFGEDPDPVGPPLHELLNYNRKEEERAKRRLYELQKQEEIRQSRCKFFATFHGLLLLLFSLDAMSVVQMQGTRC